MKLHTLLQVANAVSFYNARKALRLRVVASRDPCAPIAVLG